MSEQRIAINCKLWSPQSGEKEILSGDDFCIWKQGYLSKSVLIDSFLHRFVRNGGQWEDKMQTVFGELPDKLLGLGASNEAFFEWELWWVKVVPVNKQQFGRAHRLDWMDHRGYWVKD